jgi:hypothetical protein
MGPVEEAVANDLAEMGHVGRSGLAQSALALARLMDAKPYALTAVELRQTLLALRELAPAREEDDEVDQLRARRASVRSAG